jgi:hypothetical protein
MKTLYVFVMLLGTTTSLCASEMLYKFKSPSFSGEGFTAHALTIENLEHTRKQKLADDAKAAAAKAAADAKNTNLSKFLNNLESRIYATLSQKIAEELFKENGATSGTFVIGGNTVEWVNNGSTITLRITDPNGLITEIEVPYGSLSW